MPWWFYLGTSSTLFLYAYWPDLASGMPLYVLPSHWNIQIAEDVSYAGLVPTDCMYLSAYLDLPYRKRQCSILSPSSLNGMTLLYNISVYSLIIPVTISFFVTRIWHCKSQTLRPHFIGPSWRACCYGVSPSKMLKLSFSIPIVRVSWFQPNVQMSANEASDTRCLCRFWDLVCKLFVASCQLVD